MNNKSFLIISILLSLASIITLGSYFVNSPQEETVNIKYFPKEIGTWRSKEIPISKLETDILGTNNAFVRKYSNVNGDIAYLYIVYSQSDRKISHPPEICYTGSGISILEASHDDVQVDHLKTPIATNRLLLADKDSKQIAFYWFKTGETFTSNYWDQQIHTVLDHVMGKKSGCALIRVSIDVKGNNKARAIIKGKEFINVITPYLIKGLP